MKLPGPWPHRPSRPLDSPDSSRLHAAAGTPSASPPLPKPLPCLARTEGVKVALEPAREDPDGALRAQIWAGDAPPAAQHHQISPPPRGGTTTASATGLRHQDAGPPPAEHHRRLPPPREGGARAGKERPVAADTTRPDPGATADGSGKKGRRGVVKAEGGRAPPRPPPGKTAQAAGRGGGERGSEGVLD